MTRTQPLCNSLVNPYVIMKDSDLTHLDITFSVVDGFGGRLFNQIRSGEVGPRPLWESDVVLG